MTALLTQALKDTFPVVCRLVGEASSVRGSLYGDIRCSTSRWKNRRSSGREVKSALKASRSTVSTSTGVRLLTVAVRGLSFTSATSPNDSPRPRVASTTSPASGPSFATATSPSAIT